MKKLLPIAVALLAFLIFTVSVGAQAWYDEAWQYRVPVTVENPCDETLTDYQVQVVLDSSFDFLNALSDGSDLRVTGSDGVTLIPFWIEDWDTTIIGSEFASIWVKVPEIPALGTNIYLYYGNLDPPGPELVEVPPVGFWQKHPKNPIDLIDDPGSANANGLLAENMVYDDESGYYWLIFADYRTSPYTISLAWSEDPGDPDAWHWYEENPIIEAANAPHIMKHGDTWYVFYADNSHAWPFGVAVSTSDSITGPYTGAEPPYTDRIEVLSPGENYCPITGTPDWDAARVDEPYVFQYHGSAEVDGVSLDGKWILVYMGDQWGYTSNCSSSPGVTEQIGYAYADTIDGTYTKFYGNPVIPFGSPGEFDDGTVADPWVYEFDGTYYIGYVGAPNKAGVPADTAYVTTTDWINFNKHPINLPVGPTGSWDSDRAFRGAVSRFGDTYYLPYTGRDSSGVHRMGIATQPALLPEPLNDANKVFEFYDGFDGDALDMTKWVVKNYFAGGMATAGAGQLTITAQVIGSTRGYVQMRGTTPVPTGTLLETYAQHTDALLSTTAAEVGFKGANLDVFSNVIRIWDDPGIAAFTLQAASPLDGGPGPIESQFEFASYPPDLPQTYRVYRSTLSTAEFQIDDSDFDVLSGAYIPTGQMYGWLMSYAQPDATQSQFVVDWIRVRKYCGEDPEMVVGEQEPFNQQPIADAGPDQNNLEVDQEGCLAEVSLDGSGSEDADGDELTYSWTWDGGSATGVEPTIQLGLGTHEITLVVNDGTSESDPDTVNIEVIDTAGPGVIHIVPLEGNALQDTVTLQVDVSDYCGVVEVYFSVREDDGDEGVVITAEDYEDMSVTPDSGGHCALTFDTNRPDVTPDGYYLFLVRAIDSNGNETLSQVSFSIANWAVLELLPASAEYRAGRTVPIKFALKVAEAVDPTQPFVYSENLKVEICDSVDCQSSTYADGSRDYRIDLEGEHYITNFKTEKTLTPKEYLVEIYRIGNEGVADFLVGWFTFATTR